MSLIDAINAHVEAVKRHEIILGILTAWLTILTVLVVAGRRKADK